MRDEPAYYLGIKGVPDEADALVGGAQASGEGLGLLGRRWVGVRFDCCSVYTRLYRNRGGTAYVGCCPRCARSVKIKVGPGGTDCRFFAAE